MLALSWGLVTAVFVGKMIFLPAPLPRFFATILIGYAAGLLAAWNAVSPVTRTETPIIVRRGPGSPLPKRLNRG